MRVLRTIAELRAARAEGSASVGLVPTMGALHQGHVSLLGRARSTTSTVFLSIFVNPLQFAPHEDFDSYPRDEARDLAIAEAEGVDYVFAPVAGEMYPVSPAATVKISGPLASTLEGEARPGHFDGVATVVAKLFNMVDPDVAFFGQKDAQQVAVVKRLVSDLSMRVEIDVCPTVREPDGLAVSSRNVYLDDEQRLEATALYKALSAGATLVERSTDLEAAEKTMWQVLASAGSLQPEYAAAVDPVSFEPAVPEGPVLLAVAARLGSTRLIDNILLERP